MAKLEYKVLIVRDDQGFSNYQDWLASDRYVNYQIHKLIITDSGSLHQELLKSPPDCILWDCQTESAEELLIPVIILVTEEPAIARLNYLHKATLTKELLSSTIRHQIIQSELNQKLIKAESSLREQELLKHKLQLEQSVNLLLQSIHSSFELSSIFTAATTGIGKLLKLDRMEIIQYFPDRSTWISQCAYRADPEVLSAIANLFPEDHNLIAHRLKQGEIIAINSFVKPKSGVNQFSLDEYLGSWLLVPLVVGTEVWGAISMDCYQSDRHWLSAEVDLAINISTQLAIAIQQSIFHQELQTELRERTEAEAKRHQVEQHLQQSEHRYRQVVETQTDFILRSHKDTIITFANEALCHTLGVTLEQIIGQKWANFAAAEDIPTILAKIDVLTPENSSFLMENRDYRANQTMGWTQWINQGIFNQEGELLEIQSVGRDITALKQSEAELEQLNQDLEIRIEDRTVDLRRSKETLQISEQRFRNFFDFAPIGIAVADVQTYQFVAVNPAFCEFLGYSEDELLDQHSCDSITFPADWESERPLAEELFQRQVNSYYIEKKYIKKNGELVFGDLTATVIHDLDGNITHIIGMVQNATDRKRDKDELKRSKELLRLTIENTPIGILTFSLEGDFLTVNQDACRIFGYSAEELLKMNILDITHPTSREITVQNLHQVLSGELISSQIEKQYIHKNGKIINAIARDGIIRNEDGSPIHFVAGVEDITDRKQAEKDLNRQFERQNLITKITQQIRQSLDLEEVLTAAVNEVNNLLKGDRVIIFQLFDNGSSQVVKEIVKPDYLSILSMNWAQDNFSPIGFDYYIKAQPRVINNVTQDMWADCLSEFMIEAKVKSKIVAPIIQSVRPAESHRWQQGNSQLWGLLVVHSCREYRHWQPEEATLLQQVANQLAIAIQQADLYQQVANELETRKLLEQEIRKKAAADRLLSEITTSINKSFKLDKVVDVALQKLQKLLKSDRVLIFQFSSDGNGKVVKESVSDPTLSILERTIGDSCFATTDLNEQYLQGKVTIIEDIQTAKITPCYAELMHQYQIRANLAAPIIHSNKLWGLLLVHQCYAPRVWLPAEINLIKQVATQIGISAHKEKLYLRLKSELNQKEILLKEIHHRVKNNLQVMSSLLRMQFRKSTPEVKVLVEEYQNRIQSMALIHDQLHRSNDLAHIDFHSYIIDLTNNLFMCYSANTDLVELNLDVKDIFLPLDQSIPLGLIINELVSNTLKYAFPDGYGKINIELTQSDHSLQLKVADNGIGIPEDFDLEHTDSLGMQLVYSLTDQLEGEVKCDRTQGTAFHITFSIA